MLDFAKNPLEKFDLHIISARGEGFYTTIDLLGVI